MLSFVKLASIAAFAFGTLVSASAVPAAEQAAPAVLVPPTIIARVAPAPETTLHRRDELISQRDELSSIAAIIGNLTAALEPVLKDLCTSREDLCVTVRNIHAV